MDLRIRCSSPYSLQQPIFHPHQHFLQRTVDNCPQHLTRRQRTKWFKTAQKATDNRQLLSTLPPFYWPESNYDSPTFIHHQTAESHLRGIIHKLSNVRLYTIDTEADKPTQQHPYSIPALIQVQAIHDEQYSTILIFEMQHLPHSSTCLFHLIKQLCQMIFSSNNKLMAWGDVVKELRPFEQFNLFDLSQVTDPINLQNFFTNEWNKTHPHTTECIDRHTPMIDASASDDILICLINTDDLEDDYDRNKPIDDYNTCICPVELRPYKAKNSIWSLQKAVEFVFHLALDKSLTLNFWSCGLDLSLHTWRTTQHQHTRQSLLLYAMNDLFASTNLYFHLIKSKPTSQSTTGSSSLNTIQHNLPHGLPLFFLLTDSHGKYFPPITVTPHYKLIVKSISGLQWVNTSNGRLCTRSLIMSSTISSILSSCSGVLFIVGTNSIRNLVAPHIIEQIDDLIDLIRNHHSHLSNKTDITIASVFPCFKPSSIFTSNSSLSSNLTHYNNLLKELACNKNFTVLDLPVTRDHLNYDQMHVHVQHLPFLFNFIHLYFDDLIQQLNQIQHIHRRSRTAITRRNHKRHAKLKQRQALQTVTRPIARVWKLPDLKAYLRYHQIKYSRLPEIRRHQLTIQFNNIQHQQFAEHKLPVTAFTEQNYFDWISYEH
jgi:hypothetical protein